MPKVDDRFRIHSTDDLPTKYDGEIGYFVKVPFSKHPDFYELVTKTDGNNVIFHKSQLTIE